MAKCGNRFPRHFQTKNQSEAAHQFFRRLHKTRNDAQSEAPALTGDVLATFLGRLDEMKSGLGGDNPDLVRQILGFINNHAGMSENHEIFVSMVESGVFDLLVQLGDREEYMEPIIDIFCKMANQGEDTAFLAITNGVLAFCQRHFFDCTDQTATLIGQCFTGLIRGSMFTRALIYSTDILKALINALEEEHVNHVDEIAAKVVLAFVSEGPTPGQPNAPSVSPEQANAMWENMVQIMRASHTFEWDGVAAFCENGVNWSFDPDYLRIIQTLLRSSWPPAVVAVMEAISTYLHRDKDAGNTAFQYFLDGPGCLTAHLEHLMELNTALVWDKVMDALAAIYYCTERDPGVASEEVLDAAFQIIARFDEAPDINRAVVSACHVINNVIATQKTADAVLENPKHLAAIRRIMSRGSFDDRCAACWLFLTVINESNFEDLSSQDITTLNDHLLSDEGLALQILRTYKYLFLRQEEHEPNGRPLVNIFEECDGFSVVFQLCESENKELAKKAERFIDKFHGLDLLK